MVVDRAVDDGIEPLWIPLAANGGTGLVQSPLESHRVTIDISMGAEAVALPGPMRLAMPAKVTPAAP